MPPIHQHGAQDIATLSAADRDWLQRQGRAARLLEARQRKSVRDRRLPRRGPRTGRALPPTAPKP